MSCSSSSWGPAESVAANAQQRQSSWANPGLPKAGHQSKSEPVLQSICSDSETLHTFVKHCLTGKTELFLTHFFIAMLALPGVVFESGYEVPVCHRELGSGPCFVLCLPWLDEFNANPDTKTWQSASLFLFRYCRLLDGQVMLPLNPLIQTWSKLDSRPLMQICSKPEISRDCVLVWMAQPRRTVKMTDSFLTPLGPQCLIHLHLKSLRIVYTQVNIL